MFKSSTGYLVGAILGAILTVAFGVGAAELAAGQTVYTWMTIAGTTVGGASDPLRTDGSGHMVVSTSGSTVGGSTAGTSAEALVLTTVGGTTVGGLSGRNGITVQNNGPNDIWCAESTTGAVAPVVLKGHKISTGGYSFTWDVTDAVVVKCITTVNQITLGGTWVSETKP